MLVSENLIEPAGLVESIRDGFNGSLESLPRVHQTIPGAHPSTLLLMPAWQRGGDIGIKMVTVDARRSRQGGEAVNGVYVCWMVLPALCPPCSMPMC